MRGVFFPYNGGSYEVSTEHFFPPLGRHLLCGNAIHGANNLRSRTRGGRNSPGL